MRRYDAAAIALLASACVVKLDHEFDATPSDAGPDAAVAKGCRVLAGMAQGSDVRSIATQGTFLFVDDRGDGFTVTTPGADCAWSATPLGDVVAPTPIRADAIVAPLDLVATDVGVALYYALYVPDATAALGVRSLGVGVAPGGNLGPFTTTKELLFSADRAPYGSSAVRVGERVYAYGCYATAPFVSDCALARAPVASLSDATSYEFFDGASWSKNADDAKSVASAGASVSVRADANGRFVMTYVPPLGRTIVARTAVAPEGPWSSPTTLATCDLAGAGDAAFCGGATQQAVVGVAPGSVALTYSARSFAGGSGDAFAPRLVVLPVP